MLVTRRQRGANKPCHRVVNKVSSITIEGNSRDAKGDASGHEEQDFLEMRADLSRVEEFPEIRAELPCVER